jgi:hypothetical protein
MADGGSRQAVFTVDRTGKRREFSHGAQDRAYPTSFAASLPQGSWMIPMCSSEFVNDSVTMGNYRVDGTLRSESTLISTRQ